MATGNSGTMTEFVCGGAIRVPLWVKDFESFRRWTLSEEFPDQGNISWLGGILWVDPSMERDVHNQIKLVVTGDLLPLVRSGQLGRLYTDHMRVIHPELELSAEPDASFTSLES